MSNLNRFIEKAQAYGAALLYAPESAGDPLTNLGSAALPAGTLHNGAALVEPGLIGGGAAVQLDGSNDHVRTGWVPFVAGAAQTFVGMARRDSSAAEHSLVGSSNGGNEPCLKLLAGSQTVQWSADSSGGVFATWENAWPGNGVDVFFALVFDDAANTASLYINGSLVSTKEHAVTYNTPGDLWLGVRNNASAFLHGSLLPFAVFESALAAHQIEELNRAAKGTYPRIAVTREHPSTNHHIIVRDPKTGAAIARWAEDEPLKENVLSGIQASGALPGGKKELRASLPRDPRRDWPDLEGFLEVELNIGARNRVWHGRIGKAPRSDGDRMVIDGEAVGYAAALEDRKALRIGMLNSELGKWGEPSTARRKQLFESAIKLVASTSVGQHSKDPEAIAPAVINDFSNVETLAAATEAGEAHFEGGEIDLWKILYDFADLTDNIENANWDNHMALGTTDLFTTAVTGTDHNKKAANQQSVEAPAEGYKFARLRDWFNVASEGTDLTRIFAWKNIRVLSWLAQSLALRGEWPNVGFTAAQMLRLLIPEFSELEATEASVEDDEFVIQQAWWSDPGTLSRIVDELVKYGLYDWFVKDAKLFELRAPGTYGRNWQAYQGPSNFQETGTDTERLWDRLVVSYQDPDGSTRYVGYPGSGCEEEFESLQITDPNHPAVRAGVVREDLLVIQSVTTGTRAKEAGERFLADANELPRSGKAELSGFIQDDRGVFRPVAEVAEGDLLRFCDARDSSYRKIVNYDYDADARKVTVDLDAPSDSYQALLERFDAVLVSTR